MFGVPSFEDKGGYKVQPPPNLLPDKDDNRTKRTAGSNNQNERLFIRGKAISGTLIYKGINQFPNLEIRVGIRKKKIITKP